MKAALDDKKARRAMVEELRDSPAYRVILRPHFEALAAYHAAECRNRNLTWEKRAEHIEAAALAGGLVTYLDERAAALGAQIEALQGRKVD